jgi:AcrR family transcriptional regulator
MTVEDIVAVAEASKGSFYSRFADKESLLRYLNDVHFERVLAGWSRFLDPARWEDATVEEIVRAIVGRLVRVYRRQRHLMRAFTIQARLKGDAEIASKAARLNRHALGLASDLLERRRDEIGRSDVRAATRFGMTAVGAVAREVILYDDGPSSIRMGEARLIDELTTLFLSYLNTKRN